MTKQLYQESEKSVNFQEKNYKPKDQNHQTLDNSVLYHRI